MIYYVNLSYKKKKLQRETLLQTTWQPQGKLLTTALCGASKKRLTHPGDIQSSAGSKLGRLTAGEDKESAQSLCAQTEDSRENK